MSPPNAETLPSSADRATFERDGVVCLRQVFDAAWIDRMRAAVDHTMEHPTPIGEFVSMKDRGFTNDLWMWLEHDDYAHYVRESPAGPVACALLGLPAVTFFYDQLFVKEAGALVPTPWHHDLTFWPVEGEQIVSLWMPLDAVSRATSGLEYVRGSHRWNKRFKAVSPDYNEYLLGTDLEDPPDIDGNRDAYDLVSWDMEPGDVLAFHPLTVHGSSGNSSLTTRRRALATRWLGDDVVYAPRTATTPLPPDHGLSEGEHFHGPLFPRVNAPSA